ncbi:MAG: hypothetical protein ABSE47_12120 [Acidimicrobiales bacterium]
MVEIETVGERRIDDEVAPRAGGGSDGGAIGRREGGGVFRGERRLVDIEADEVDDDEGGYEQDAAPAPEPAPDDEEGAAAERPAGAGIRLHGAARGLTRDDRGKDDDEDADEGHEAGGNLAPAGMRDEEGVEEIAAQERRPEGKADEAPARKALVADDRHVGDQMLEGCVVAGDDEKGRHAHDDPDSPAPRRGLPPARQHDEQGDECDDARIRVDLGKGEPSAEGARTECPPAEHVGHEQLEKIRPGERAAGNEREARMGSLGHGDETHRRQPLQRPDGHADRHAAAGPEPEAEAPGTSALRFQRLQPEVEEIEPAHDDRVDDDVGAPAQADPGGCGGEQEAVPGPGGRRVRRQPVQGDERPRQCGGGGGEVDVYHLRADETSQAEACARQRGRQRPAARPTEEQLASDGRRRQHGDLADDPCRQRREDGEHQGDGEQCVGVRAPEERRPRPEEGVPEGKVTVTEDLPRQLLEGIVLGEIVAGDERIAGSGGSGEQDGGDAGEKAAGLPVRRRPARPRHIPDRGHARS